MTNFRRFVSVVSLSFNLVLAARVSAADVQAKLDQLNQREKQLIEKLEAVQQRAKYIEMQLEEVRRRKQYISSQQAVRKPGAPEPAAVVPSAPTP